MQFAQMHAKAIRSAHPIFDCQAMEVTSKRLQHLLEHWTSLLRTYHTVGETACTPGSMVATMVCKHMRRLFSEHRNALQTNEEYAHLRGPGCL